MATLTKLLIRPSTPLSLAQRQQLAVLCATDPAVQARWQELRAAADAALIDPPLPIAQLNYEGLLDFDPTRLRTVAAIQDMQRLTLLNDAHAAGGAAAHQRHAIALLCAWAETYTQPTGNPINEEKLEPLVAAYHQHQAALTPAQTRLARRLLHQLATAAVEGPLAYPHFARGNWGSKRLKLIGAIGSVLADQQLLTLVTTEARAWIAADLYADGGSYDLQRRDALHYHQSGLKPLVALARWLGPAGPALYVYQAPSGASIGRSIALLLPYLTGRAVHREWVKSQVAHDRRRAAAGIEYYQPGQPYDPRDSAELLMLASRFDPTLGALAIQLSDRPTERYPTWLSVLNQLER
jgi:Alginate lyase